jgi:eukaryotic-like serine/threonine-protein kinase
MPAPDPAPTPELLAFQAAVAGRYSIVHEVGRGGMGIVFLAREVALDRMVALKLLPPDMAVRPGMKESFVREARTAARLSHPNIVQIYSVDEAGDFVFFAMAFIDGGTLGDRVRDRGPLSNSDAVRLLREVSWALGHAHLQGVVHRDVKPDNILLDQKSGRALVTDFGIAAVGEDPLTDEGIVVAREGESMATRGGGSDAAAGDGTYAGTDDETLAGRGQVVGTAEFMSPEQATGGVVDARSDLYSLACVGFYALSGQVPFEGPSASAILIAHVNEPAPSVLSVAPHVPPVVANVLGRCLRKDPDMRFAAGEALADALQPEAEADREVPVALRVFIKETRGWETSLAYSLLGLVLTGPALVAVIATGAPPMWPLGLGATVAALMGVPVVTLLRATRRLLKSGFTQADATVAFLRDISRKEEEFRFQVGERFTGIDYAIRTLKVGGLSIAASSFTMAAIGSAVLNGQFDFLWTLGGSMLPAGLTGLLIQEIRARARGDVMGERYLRFWKSKMGAQLFKLAGINLKSVAPALSAGVHRPTEAVIGLEADRLFEALPKETRRSLAGLPETVHALEADAQAMRKQIGEMEVILAEVGDDDPLLPSAAERRRVRSGVEATRNEAKDKLREAVAALETIRLGLLYMQAGTGTVESLTMELKSAQGISDDMDNLLAGHREVERILRERRETGVFSLVDGPPTGPPSVGTPVHDEGA